MKLHQPSLGSLQNILEEWLAHWEEDMPFWASNYRNWNPWRQDFVIGAQEEEQQQDDEETANDAAAFAANDEDTRTRQKEEGCLWLPCLLPTKMRTQGTPKRGGLSILVTRKKNGSFWWRWYLNQEAKAELEAKPDGQLGTRFCRKFHLECSMKICFQWKSRSGGHLGMLKRWMHVVG